MNLRQLKMLKTIAQCQSISKAAACLYLSQSALTRQLLAMEKELGFTLFHRHRDGIEPTDSGSYFIEQLDPILEAYDSAIFQAKQIASSHAKLVRIGICSYTMNIVPHACKEASRHFPSLLFDYYPCRLTDTQQALLQNKMDLQLLASCAPSLHQQLSSIPLFFCSYCCKIPQGHPYYTKMETLTLTKLAHQKVLLLRTRPLSNSHHQTLLSLLEAHQIEVLFFDTPQQAEAISLAQKIPILTLSFPSETSLFSIAMLEQLPQVRLGLVYRKKDQVWLGPLLNYFQEYFHIRQKQFPFCLPIIEKEKE